MGELGEIFLFREKKEAGSDSDNLEKEKKEQEEQTEEGLFCRYCGHHITSVTHRIEMDGQHHHAFFNPAGIIYEIRCFNSAKGCVPYGPSSGEFTWFAGYRWRLSLCAVCSAHMGWTFSSADHGFFGLIAKNLVS